MGVFCSRSSLSWFKVPRNKLWILTALQLVNFTFYFANTKWLFAETLWINIPLMIWVGFMGGAAYVNVMYSILELETLKREEKEVAIVLTLFSNDLGVCLSSVFT